MYCNFYYHFQFSRTIFSVGMSVIISSNISVYFMNYLGSYTYILICFKFSCSIVSRTSNRVYSTILHWIYKVYFPAPISNNPNFSYSDFCFRIFSRIYTKKLPSGSWSYVCLKIRTLSISTLRFFFNSLIF